MEILFYLAEEFREEKGGKLTAIGLYPHRSFTAQIDLAEKENFEKVNSIKEPLPLALDRLCLVFSLKGNAGQHHAHFEIIDPKQTAKYRNDQDFEMQTGKTHTLLIQIAPFIYLDVGTYTARLTVDEEVHDFPFEVKIEPLG